MQYAQFGKTGLTVSRFGLGCMRFPANEQEAIAMVRYAIDNGVNYLDTAYVYGNSEIITGKALRDGYRNKTYLASKNPVWEVKSHADFEKFLDEQLVRLGTDHIDVYLLHNLNPEGWQQVQRYDGLSFLDKMVQKGKILHTAFSAHTTLNHFKEIIDAYDWEMTQVQLNILDEHQQVGVEGLRYAAKTGMATVIMEPLRGGCLLTDAPAEVRALVDQYGEQRPLIDWCFRWLYNMSEVSLILSGTSSLEQLKDNLRIFEDARPGVMSEEDLQFIARLKAAYEANQTIGCTGCRYCTPCPKGVSIPEIFKTYNNFRVMNRHGIDKHMYRYAFAATGIGADQCASCGLCEQHCPQGLHITELLKMAHEELMEA